MTAYPIISSKDNPSIKTANALLTQARMRKKLNQTVIEGVHLLDAYLNAKLLPNTVIVSESGLNNAEIDTLIGRIHQMACVHAVKILTISDGLYKQIRTLGECLPIMAMIDTPNLKLNQKIDTDCLIVNGVQDNGNLGTLFRTASAVGFSVVICTQGTAQAYSPKTLRASMGANFSLTIYENTSIEQILQHVKIPLFATSSHSDSVIYHTDLTQSLALLMGHEGQGVDKVLLDKSHKLALPQPNGQESLNVGVAGSVCLYEILRQRSYA
ncbi:tRNA/rRNA methyltransferase SpoU [Moraxella macacae 0408225]|uniref:tRNA/rRNA methyltransferase SpoU n=1 Tax=Moraxella macacae 0408225 TaxID=1230338 RepID=L2F7B3_9GAMM|nr:RNA methyltransferase [Moraxella macacae]ELA08646.1 tRNA/rRNA methyltransferase SpoU [Moraxella macacae 0408225]